MQRRRIGQNILEAYAEGSAQRRRKVKQMIFAMMIAISFGLTNVSHATTVDAEKQSTQATTEKDATALQKSVEELGQMFGVEQQKKEKPKMAETSSTEKTVAQVMDKAIDKVSDVVGAMAQAINKIAPDVWRIMIKQQYAKAIMNCVVPIGLLLVLFVYMKLVGLYWKPEKEESADFTEWEIRMALVRVIPTIVACIAGLWFFNRLADSISLLINPEFYAIQDLLRMILNKGM